MFQHQFQPQNASWIQQPIPPGAVPVPMWAYPTAPGSNSAPHSHPMSPLLPNFSGSGSSPFPHQNWGMTPLRDLQTKQSKEHIVDQEDADNDEDDRLDNSPIAEAILKRPHSFSRSRSRTGITSDGSAQHKNTDGDDKHSSSSEHPSPSPNGTNVSDENPDGDVNHTEDTDKPFLDELVFPSLLGR